MLPTMEKVCFISIYVNFSLTYFSFTQQTTPALSSLLHCCEEAVDIMIHLMTKPLILEALKNFFHFWSCSQLFSFFIRGTHSNKQTRQCFLLLLCECLPVGGAFSFSFMMRVWKAVISNLNILWHVLSQWFSAKLLYEKFFILLVYELQQFQEQYTEFILSS